MKLSKDIFETVLDYTNLLLYLYSEKAFTIDQICSRFNISKWVAYKQVKYWEEKGYVGVLTTLGEGGGKQYKYQISDKFQEVVEDILVSLLKSRGFTEQEIKGIIKG